MIATPIVWSTNIGLSIAKVTKNVESFDDI